MTYGVVERFKFAPTLGRKIWMPTSLGLPSINLPSPAILYKMYDLDIINETNNGATMRFISATDAKQNFAALLDDAQRGPVVIRRQSRDQAVVISPQEYARLRGLAVADFQAFCDRVGQTAVERGLTERKLASLLRTDD